MTRRSSALLPATMLALLLGSPAVTAQGRWSDAFDQPGLGAIARTFSLGTYRNELVAGTNKSFGTDGRHISHIAHFDGERWLPFGQGVNGQVRAVLEWNGSLYVGGGFGRAGGGFAPGIARWDGRSWHAVGAGFNGEVWALAVFRGQLHAAGRFDHSGTKAVARIARFDGSRWQPVGGGIHRTGFQAEVRTLLATGNKLYAGGSFDRAGTTPAAHVAVWDGTTWRALGAGMNRGGSAIVMTLATYGSKIVAGGVFGQAGLVAAKNVAAWDGTSWSAMGRGLFNSTLLAFVGALREFGGALYAGGSFVSIGNPTSPGAIPVPRFAKWDGRAWSKVGGVSQGPASPNFIGSMAIWDGKLWVGGDFTVAGKSVAVGQALVSRFVASFDGQSWGAAGRGLGLDAEPRSLTAWNGGLVATGRFIQAGSAFSSEVAFFDGDGWRTLGTFDNIVEDAVPFGKDLVVTGNFFRVNGTIFPGGIARFDGTRWSPMGQGFRRGGGQALAVYKGQLYVAGLGSPKRWNGSRWQTFGTPIFGSLETMHVHGGLLYLGGTTPFMPGRPNLFVWDGSKLAVAHGGTDGNVRALATLGTDLIAGGNFTRVGTVNASRLARFDGSKWSQLGPGILGRSASVTSLAVLRGSLYVGGNYTSFSGNAVSWLGRFDGRGFQKVGQGIDGPALVLFADEKLGRLYAGGLIRHAGGKPAASLGMFELAPQITDLGLGLAGRFRRTPFLGGRGILLAGRSLRLALSSARERSTAVLVLGSRRLDLPLFGGTLVPSVDASLVLPTDRIGLVRLSLIFPPAVPSGTRLFAQAWVLDAAAPSGLSASNGLALRTP